MTIIAAGLVGAASVAPAETQNITFTDTNSGEAILSDSVFVTSGDLTLSNASLTVNPTTWSDGDTNGGILRPVGAATEFLPNVRIDGASSNSWALTFTLTNTSAVGLTVNSLGLSGLTARALDGTYQGSSRTISFTLTSGDVTLATNQRVALADSTSTGNHSTTLDFSSNALTLGANESVQLTLTASNSNANTLVGLSGMSVGYASVPEPATATLSLLALAGLCARRRRK